MSLTSSYKDVGNRHKEQSGKDCMTMFWESLRENAMQVISFKTKKWNY